MFVSIFFAFDKSSAIYGWYRIVLGIVLFWLVTVFPFSFRKVSWAFVFSGAAQSVFALWQFFTQSTFANKWLGLALHEASERGVFVVENAAGRFLRAYGSFPHPNMLGGFLAVAILLLLGIWLNSNFKNKSLFIVNCSLLIILSAGLFVSFSRSVWLALTLSLVFIAGSFVYKKIKLKNFLKPMSLMVLTFIILGIMFPDLLLTRLGGTERLEQISTERRIEYLSEAKNVLSEKWLTGTGIGNYTFAIYNKIDSTRESWDYEPVHNIYLLIFAELGMAGILVFLLLTAYGLRLTAYKLLAKFDINAIIIFSAIFSLYIIGFFDHYLWTLYFGIMFFWLTLGLWFKNIKD